MPIPSFRLLHKYDAAAYQGLRLEALSVNPNSFLSVHAQESKRSLLAYQYELENAQANNLFGYYGVFLDGALVGYVQLGGSFLPKQAHIGFLYNLYVSHGHRRLGLARQLFTFVIETVRRGSQIERLYITCNASNQEASHFYQAMGFVVWGRKTGSVKWQGTYDDEVEWVLEIAR